MGDSRLAPLVSSDVERRTLQGWARRPEASAAAVHDSLLERAERDMFQEGHELASCVLQWSVVVEEQDGTLVSEIPYTYGDAPAVGTGLHCSLRLTATAALPHVAGRPRRAWRYGHGSYWLRGRRWVPHPTRVRRTAMLSG